MSMPAFRKRQNGCFDVRKNVQNVPKFGVIAGRNELRTNSRSGCKYGIKTIIVAVLNHLYAWWSTSRA